ncbi:MAG TPA: polymer-forming cytoskeletal protein [bacterium]|nr:polymer-forming cytoskeletal protein [bacterium]
MKKGYYLLFLLTFLLFPLVSRAYVMKSSDFIYIAKDEVVEGNLYFAANSLTIEGEVLGDVIGIGTNIQVNGKVSGDIIAISQNLKINGQVDGNLRTLSSLADISGNINKNVNILGENLIFEEKSNVGQDLMFLAVSSEFNGKIKGNLHGEANNILIRGSIEKDSNLTLDQIKRKKYYNILQIEDSAEIMGGLNYKGGQDAIIKTDKISGEIHKTDPFKNNKTKSKTNKIFFSIFSSLIIALIINILFKNKITGLKNIFIKENYKLTLSGLLILFLTPLAVILLAITIIGLPLAIMLLIFWGLTLYLGKIIIAMALGDYIFKYFHREKTADFLKISSGVILVSLVIIIPYIGWIFSLLFSSLSLGAVYYIIKNKKYVN